MATTTITEKVRFDAAEIGATIKLADNMGEFDAKVVSRQGEGEERTITLSSTHLRQFDVYRFRGRWVWGSSASHVRCLGVVA